MEKSAKSPKHIWLSIPKDDVDENDRDAKPFDDLEKDLADMLDGKGNEGKLKEKIKRKQERNQRAKKKDISTKAKQVTFVRDVVNNLLAEHKPEQVESRSQLKTNHDLLSRGLTRYRNHSHKPRNRRKPDSD